MSWTDAPAGPTPKTRAELRRFGLVMAAALVVIGGFLLWRGRGAAPYLLGGAAAFLVTGLALPGVLRPIERGWMWLAEKIGTVVTAVVVTLTFFLVITPVGLAMRLFSGDTMGLKLDRGRESYWTPVDPDGPGSRPDKPF